MTDQESTSEPKDRMRLFYICLILSLAFHIVVVLVFYFAPLPPNAINKNKPTVVRLVDLPTKTPQPSKSTENKQNSYEIDQLPSSDRHAPDVESQRKADRNQQVPKEQARKGLDSRDETISRPSSSQTPKNQSTNSSQPTKESKGKQLKQPTPTDTSGKLSSPQTETRQPTELTPEQLLPDAQTLTQIAQGKVGDKNRVKQRDDVDEGDITWLNLQSGPLVSFFRRFNDRIERVWNYPKEAIKDKLEGTVELLIIVNKEGELIDVQPTKSSGSDILDMQAIEAVYAAAPFGPLGKYYQHETVNIKAQFIYRFIEESPRRYIFGR